MRSGLPQDLWSLIYLYDATYHILWKDVLADIRHVFRRYYNNGTPWISCGLDSQKRFHGKYRQYHDNGRLDIVASYHHGRMHGECRVYSVDGSLEYQTEYVDGMDCRITDT
jgi:antitoxin component YwqK of YwqJK toxin-antitoxin module